MPPKRSLFLHLSALSDTEYSVYLESLHDIFDDEETRSLSEDELESRKISIPLVRAWMKGRFRDLSHADIDKVLHLFANQTPSKEISGGQLLAALRLLMHVRRGGDAYEGNVFVQAEPSSPTVSRQPTFSPSSNLGIHVEPPTTDAPVSPKLANTRTNPFHNESYLNAAASFARPGSTEPDYLRRTSLSSAPAAPSPSPPAKPRIDGVGVPPGSTNPFLQRAKTHSGAYQAGTSGRTPPLPPRKPSHMTSSAPSKPPPPLPVKPGQTPSLLVNTSGASSSSSQGSLNVNLKSPPPIPPHRVTPLMQQSLLASRVGASLKKAQQEASRTRILEVIRSSSDTPVLHSGGVKDRGRAQSSSRSPDKGIRRPVPQPPRSAIHHHIVVSDAKSDTGAPSITSLAEVAAARLDQPRLQARPDSLDRISSDSSDEDRGQQGTSRSRQPSASEQFSPPPMHPARRPSARISGRGRHLRSPSHQVHSVHGSPRADFSSINKSVSAPGVAEQSRPSRSPSPSPSPSPVSPNQGHLTRSRSLRQSSASTLAGRLTESSSFFPPSQRKRPESVQVISRPRGLDLDINTAADVDPASPFSNSFSAQSRDSNGTRSVTSIASRFEQTSNRGGEKEKGSEKDKDTDQNAFAFTSLQRTFNALQQKAQPTITRARFKAEAGLLAPRRGFVPNGRDYHLAGEGGDCLVVSQNTTGDEGGMDFTPVTDTDYDDTSGDDTIRARGRSRSENTKHQNVARDNFKLPEGEGWTRL